MRPTILAALLFAAPVTSAQPPRPTQTPPPPVTATPGGAAQPGAPRGAFRRGVQVMTLSSPAWPDGGRIPDKYAQSGGEASPPLAWSNVPDEVMSFVLVVHDVDAAVGNGTDDTLQWLVWNLPASARSLPEAVPQGPEMPDGARQISATGPFYRGPGAAASGPSHHYVFELYAVDTKVEVAAVGQSPAQTRAAVEAAMAGHVRGKGVYVGIFKRAAGS